VLMVISIQRQRNPEQSVTLFRVRFVDLYFRWHYDFAFERSVIDLHRQQLHLAPLGVGRLWQLACAANQHAPRFHRQIDERTFNACKVNTDADAFFAAIRIDCRLPSVRRKSRESRACQFRSHLMQRAVQPAQLDAANWVHWNVNLHPTRSVFNRSAIIKARIAERNSAWGYVTKIFSPRLRLETLRQEPHPPNVNTASDYFFSAGLPFNSTRTRSIGPFPTFSGRCAPALPHIVWPALTASSSSGTVPSRSPRGIRVFLFGFGQDDCWRPAKPFPLQFARPPKRAARFGAGVLAIFENLHAVYKNMLHPDRVLVRLLVRRAIGDRRLIEHDHVREHSLFKKTAMIEAEIGGREPA